MCHVDVKLGNLTHTGVTIFDIDIGLKFGNQG